MAAAVQGASACVVVERALVELDVVDDVAVDEVAGAEVVEETVVEAPGAPAADVDVVLLEHAADANPTPRRRSTMTLGVHREVLNVVLSAGCARLPGSMTEFRMLGLYRQVPPGE